MGNSRNNRHSFVGVSAFTLIELLIVVAIIAILAAIAVPNFLEAQTRSKVSRVKADMRSLGTAIHSYHVDNNAYPPNNALNPADPLGLLFNTRAMLIPLSSPISYIANSHLLDPFGSKATDGLPPILTYVRLHPEEGLITVLYPMAGISPATAAKVCTNGFYVQSLGPDGTSLYAQLLEETQNQSQALSQSIQGFISGNFTYDPTNGTVSRGDISYTAKGFIHCAH